MSKQTTPQATPQQPLSTSERLQGFRESTRKFVDEHNKKQTPQSTPDMTPRTEATLRESADLERISREQTAAMRKLGLGFNFPTTVPTPAPVKTSDGASARAPANVEAPVHFQTSGGAAASATVQNHVKTSDGASARAPANVEAPVHFQTSGGAAVSAPVQNHVQSPVPVQASGGAGVPTARTLVRQVVGLLSEAVNSPQVAQENSATKQALAESQSALAESQGALAKLQRAHAELQSAHAELQSEFAAKVELLVEADNVNRANSGLWNEVQRLKSLLQQINGLSHRE